MPFGLKSIWFQLVTLVIVTVWFVLRFASRYGAGVFDGPDGLMALGRMVLWFVAATIVAMIAAHIIGLIILAIAEGGEEPDTTTDERDRAIELRGDRVSNTATGLGMLAGMIVLTFGGAVPVMVATMFVGSMLGAVVGSVVKLFLYAEG